jgi:DEAD/DEAH box helicase domain-containing protein
VTPFAQSFFTSLSEQLNRDATRAALGLLSFRSDALREHLRSLFQSAPGTGESFLADPVFEATFGWLTVEDTLGDLAGELVHPDVVQALSEPREAFAEEYTFPAQRQPYQHQVEAWQDLIKTNPARSVLVTSGTGSGKTECFLVPILHDLATELETRTSGLTGVRALFIYPLNALIKNQRDRLTAWSEPFGGRLRYCLYNGETPNESRAIWQSEVCDRKTLRTNPPPILVTNATMLEYMLVRAEDQPILDQSQGMLRWIVIDEAHNYIGSQAAELTLLLRRALHAFGCNAEDVHFIATSATIADNDADADENLRNFLADIAGVQPERVSVVYGQREVPILPEVSQQRQPLLPNLTTLDDLSSQERFQALAASPGARQVRSALIEQAHSLSELASLVLSDDGEQARDTILQLLDLCTQAADENGKPFLPLRGHFFHRALNGLWACANAACEGRQGTPLDNLGWAFGRLFMERRQHCDTCGSPVYELVQCGECGAEYLSVVEVFKQGDDWLQPRLYERDEDEFQIELEPLDEEDEEAEPSKSPAPSRDFPRLLVSDNSPQTNSIGLLDNGRLDWSRVEGVQVHLLGPDPDRDNKLCCPCCKTRDRQGDLFRPVRLGAPFLLQTAIPTLLCHLPPYNPSASTLPLDGRRLISFTDSRQGTARFSSKLQLETERNFVRSLLYHSIADRARPTNGQAVDELRKEIAALEQAIQASPSLRHQLSKTLAEKRSKLQYVSEPVLGKLSWHEAQNKLLADTHFTHWLLPPLREQTFGLNDRQLAELCLWREFFLRPKRQFSLETMGLLRLDYPAVAKITSVPAVAAQHQVTLQEWQSLVCMTLDFQIRVRKSVAIPRDMLRWIGYPGVPTVTIGPEQRKTQKFQLTWPSTRTVVTRRSRLVRLLAYTLKLNPGQTDDQALIEEFLHALWEAVRPLLSRNESGYFLELDRQAEIVQVNEAWLCPVTRRLLPVTFRGVTPYLPEQPDESLALCQKVDMPTVPHPFWLEADHEQTEHWLETDPAIRNLRTSGAWSNLNDRIARFSPYFRSVEHSAQITGAILSDRENQFKAGKINLMSCSTTMEMGVDIGGLTGVTMNNVPPHPANFLQRAGRAGRRGETVALSFTLCKSNPHGEAVFRNPLWPFTTALAMPRVSLQSARIVQRHINALNLATFLAHSAPDDIRRLNSGWFFEATHTDSSAPAEHFSYWCQAEARHDHVLHQGMRQLLRRTALEGRSIEELLAVTATMLNQVVESWRTEVDALLENQKIVKTREGKSKPERAIDFQLERIRREYLLSELATRHFLPGYGFPTDVVSLVTTTAEDLDRRGRQQGQEREDNRALRRSYPARELAIAIRDYAPGTDTVLDGRVYRSDGVTLNWHIPPAQEGPPEIQSLRWVWRCKDCGANGTRPTMPASCSHCSSSNLTRFEYLQPASFAVDIRCQPHNNVTMPQYIPVRDPLISLEGADWLAMPSPTLGRYRISMNGALFHHSDGLYNQGYALCLRCGRADSMIAEERLPLPFADEHGKPRPHRRLRGGKNNDREKTCPGSHEPWAIKTGLRLGLVTHTEILELQLHDLTTGRPIDRVTAYSLAVALRRAVAQRLGIEEREIGCTTNSSRSIEGYIGHSIYLFDTASGGAGYVSQAMDWLPELFDGARDILACPRNCDAACQSCLLTYDTQHNIDDLDRKCALGLLSEAFLNAMRLPVHLQAFGSATRLEMEPLIQALRRELQRNAWHEIRFYLGGPAEAWEPLDWRFYDDLRRFKNADLKIYLIAPNETLAQLTPSQRDELATLIAITDAKFYTSPIIPETEGVRQHLPVTMEIGNNQNAVRWASSHADALAPTAYWGSGEGGAQFVRAHHEHPLPPLAITWSQKSAAALRTASGTFNEISITTEFDGSLRQFGQRAWQRLCEQAPMLQQQLAGDQPLVELRYSDRYLRSPLTVLLLRELVGALANYPGGLVANTRVSIATSSLRRNDTLEPRWLYHDWQDATDRKQVFNRVFDGLGQFTFSETSYTHLSHAREFQLTWNDGISWTLRLDQGVGYWHTSNYREPFPFYREVVHQVEYLLLCEIDIRAGEPSYPTFWYVGLA